MKGSAVLLCLIFTAAAFSAQVLAQPGNTSTCCTRFTSSRPPLGWLVSYRIITKSDCPRAAVAFKTRGGKEICIDPKKKWVQNITKYLDRRKPENTNTLRSFEHSFLH